MHVLPLKPKVPTFFHKEHSMQEKIFSIPNISCGHCTGAIESELKEMAGIASVTGDVAGKKVTVEWDAPASEKQIIEKLKEINYPAE
jgi:copper chaperone